MGFTLYETHQGRELIPELWASPHPLPRRHAHRHLDARLLGEEGLAVVHVQCDPAALSQDGLGVLGELAQHRDGVGRAYGAERLRRLVPHLVVLGRGLGP